MSLMVETKNGGSIETSFIGLNPTVGVQIGHYEISLEDFSAMATHFLSGGLFGWERHQTPESVNKALSTLFEFYEQVDGKWVRKAKWRI